MVCLPKKGIVVREPSVVAQSVESEETVAIGKEAQVMLGRTPEDLVAYQPLKDGVIADFNVTEAMLRHYINSAIGRFRLLKPDIMISIPAGATSTERKAVIDAALSAGARNVYLIQEPVAAALGARVPITSPAGNMIIDIGGGTTEVAVISLGGIVSQNSIRVGGNKIDSAITDYLRRTHNLSVGEKTAEKIKKKIGYALDPEEPKEMDVKGRDIVGGFQKPLSFPARKSLP